MSRDSILSQKSKAFAKGSVMLYRYLTDEHKEFVLSKQILRGGTSIGANIAEAIYAGSRKGFFDQTPHRPKGSRRNTLLAGVVIRM